MGSLFNPSDPIQSPANAQIINAIKYFTQLVNSARNASTSVINSPGIPIS
jgi:hypothetical protein